MITPVRVLIATTSAWCGARGLTMILKLLRDADVVGTASDGNEAVALASELHPDVLLMDLRMPYCDGGEATRLLERKPAGVVVRACARGYLTKDASGPRVRETLHQVLTDHAAIDSAV
jgi:DNA-binding NarL/FixJ family response regulator